MTARVNPPLSTRGSPGVARNVRIGRDPRHRVVTADEPLDRVRLGFEPLPLRTRRPRQARAVHPLLHDVRELVGQHRARLGGIERARLHRQEHLALHA